LGGGLLLCDDDDELSDELPLSLDEELEVDSL
jgi:hypothetical protein